MRSGDPGRMLLILDYDGTLCSTHTAIVAALRSILSARSLPVPCDAEVHSLVGSGITIAETLCRLHPESSGLTEHDVHVMVAEYRLAYEEISAEHVTLFPGVRETLQRLREIASIVVASNKGAAAINASLKRFGLADLVSLVAADEGGRPLKPDQQVFTQRILPNFPQLGPGRALMVGDTEIDLKFASAAGLASCWASYGFGNEDRCAEAGFDYRIDAFRELLPIVAERASLQ